jgi:hypothetical protein
MTEAEVILKTKLMLLLIAHVVYSRESEPLNPHPFNSSQFARWALIGRTHHRATM